MTEPIKPKYLSIKILKFQLFYLYHHNGFTWFRIIGGIGLHWKDTTKHQPLFSERNKLIKTITIGKYLIRFLPKNRPIT